MTRSFNSRTHHHTTMNMFSRYSRIAHPSNHIVNKQAINPCSIAVDQSLSIFFPYNVCTWTFFFFYPFFSLSRDIPFLPLWNDYTAICRSSSILSSLVTWNPRCVHFFFLPFLFRCIFDDNRRGLSDIWISIPMFHRRAAILNRDFLSTTGISLSPRCAIVTPLFKRSIDFSFVKISPPRGWLMMLICISRSSIDSIICNSQFFFFFPFGGRKTRETRTPLRNVGPRIVKTHRSFDSKKKTLFFREKREQKFQHESSNLRDSKFEIFFKLDLII